VPEQKSLIVKLIDHPERPLTFAFEDDGRTGYGYLHGQDAHICANVWLYNREATPAEPEWTDREGAPFRNSAQFARHEPLFEPPVSEEDIDVKWIVSPDGRNGVIILLRGAAIGELYEEMVR